MASRTILIVDDPELIRKLQGSFLNRGECRVVTTACAEAAGRAGRELPDLVVLTESDGPGEAVEACRAIKSSEATRKIPVLMIASESNYPMCLEAGADDLLAAPPSRKHLLQRVRTLLPGFLRAARRRSASVRVACFQGDEERLGYTKDLAETGMFLKIRESFEVSDPVQLIFELPTTDRPTIRAEADVVRRVASDRDSHLVPGIGVRFRSLSERDRGALARWVGEA